MAARLLHGLCFSLLSKLWFKSKFYRSRPLHRRSIHAEFKPLHRLNEISKKWRRVSFTDAFVHCPDFGSKSKFYRSRPLHRRSIHAEFKPLHRLNEVSKNGGASPSRTLLFIVQTLVQNRNFIDPGLYTGGVFMLSSNLYTG
ncbi:hypothetical protein TNCV_2514421 [Trichonephila clavipes]|nr:hypothetical protein TNCV_2514421 [Trichonephila clavipes]